MEIEAFGRKWKRVWVEDECTRHWPANDGHEYVDGAWKRIFGEEHPEWGARTGEEDWGDATARLFGERMEVSSLDGDSIYVPVDTKTESITPSPSTCQKCNATSGDDWSQCGGSCPVPGSPHYVPPGGTYIPGPLSLTGRLPRVDPDPYTAMVREFHQRMGLVVRDAPSLGTPAEREERIRLMLEELLELARALGVQVFAQVPGILAMDELTLLSDMPPDLPAALHELADLQVTVSGTAVQLGLPLLPAVRAVHAANMEKTPQGPGRKPLKPDGWKPPDVSKMLTGSGGGGS